MNQFISAQRRWMLVAACAAIVLGIALPYSLNASAQPAESTDPTQAEGSKSFRYKPDDSVLQALTEEQALDLLRQVLHAKPHAVVFGQKIEGFYLDNSRTFSFNGAWRIAQIAVADDRITLRFSRQDRKEKEFLYHELAAIETAYEPGFLRTLSYVSLNAEFALLVDVDLRSSFESKATLLRKLADALHVLKRSAEGVSPERDKGFAEVAARYRASVEKPPFPEEARRFRVQAEAAVREKRMGDAARLYGDALKLAPWWPEGRFNRSLLLAETNRYGEAIAEMKRYLMLVPDAPNARAALDKIYEWEAKATRR